MEGINKVDVNSGRIYEMGLFSATSAAATEHIVVLKR